MAMVAYALNSPLYYKFYQKVGNAVCYVFLGFSNFESMHTIGTGGQADMFFENLLVKNSGN